MAHRSTFGWTERNTGKSPTDQKENVVGQGLVVMYVLSFCPLGVGLLVGLLMIRVCFIIVFRPGESLRLSRPRPRGWTTRHPLPSNGLLGFDACSFYRLSLLQLCYIHMLYAQPSSSKIHQSSTLTHLLPYIQLLY
jgi:hypothetical protein